MQYMNVLCQHLIDKIRNGKPVQCLHFTDANGQLRVMCVDNMAPEPERKQRNSLYAYPYIYRGVALKGRQGQFCKLIKAARNKSTVEFEDGLRFNLMGMPVILRS